MKARRESGILLHVTSLPSSQGIGNFGEDARRFVDCLVRMGQSLWQVLPLGPTGYGNSPYQSYSAFAGNSLLISLGDLVEEGLLEAHELPAAGDFSDDHVEFDRSAARSRDLLRIAFDRFEAHPNAELMRDLVSFVVQEKAWLDDYALFLALKAEHGGATWTHWHPRLRSRKPAALRKANERLRKACDFERFVQFIFYRQWMALKTYANERGVSIIGDLPIFVAHDSADVWTHQDLFELREDGRPSVVAGVPPDYFSATGQLWGNPLYRWKRMKTTRYRWWIERIRNALMLFDRIRIDHFRGFEAYWEIPGDAETAIGGRWVLGPGASLFNSAKRKLGELPIIAEDLGLITPEVEELRDELGFPGMKVLQFAFGSDSGPHIYQPHNFSRHTVVYTGTHDNDTTVGWFRRRASSGSSEEQLHIQAERERVRRYTGTDGTEIHWDMIRLALASIAETAVFPLQDVLGLGSESRMNMPGSSHGNWSWRFKWDQLLPWMGSRLLQLTSTYERRGSIVMTLPTVTTGHTVPNNNGRETHVTPEILQTSEW